MSSITRFPGMQRHIDRGVHVLVGPGFRLFVNFPFWDKNTYELSSLWKSDINVQFCYLRRTAEHTVRSPQCIQISVCFVADEREDVQKKTFAKWINSQLLKVSICN
jgi:hypothetical protein